MSKRQQLIDTALDLVTRHGFHATGIDRILAEAGAAKATLYHHFRSKEDLLLAALRQRDERFRARFFKDVERRASTPSGRVLALFEALAEIHESPEFTGCLFLNACAEYSNPEHPLHRLACEHKTLVLEFIRKLLREAGAGEPEPLAEQILMLMEGATVSTKIRGRVDAALRARDAARVLLETASSSAT